MDLTKLYKKQISFTEWFEKINHNKIDELRSEDYDKRERLKVMKKLFGLPYDQPTQFKAIDLVKRTPEFELFLKEHGEELCALRLNPVDNTLPKARLRGPTVRKVMDWFAEQKIDPAKYNADFVPHCNSYDWSTIFFVNSKGIFGEIIRGGHYQLTQGFYDNEKPIVFNFDFTTWKTIPENKEAEEHLKEIVKYLKISEEIKPILFEKFQATFSENYLCGYFETVKSKEHGLWFVDYNRILGGMYGSFSLPTQTDITADLNGNPASPGKVQGKVKIIHNTELENPQFEKGQILVCKMTTPEFVPLMQKAAAIITDQGGVLTHAAIISRELGVPCITGTNMATEKLKNGDLVEVDANNGTIRKIISENNLY